MAGRREIEAALRHMAPRMPRHEFEAVLDHATGSAGLSRAVPETAVWLSLVAYIRHVFTEYDALLDDGYDRESARHFVREDINERLAEWGVRRRIAEDEEEPAPDSD